MFEQIKISFLVFPTKPIEILQLLLIMLLAGIAIFQVANNGNLLKPSKPVKHWPILLLLSFFIPAFFEEIIFRGLWYAPNRTFVESAVSLFISTTLFVTWHFIQGKTFHKKYVTVFTNPHFLVCTAILGLSCSLMLAVSGSIWVSIIFHWLVVFIWQARYGGVIISFGWKTREFKVPDIFSRTLIGKEITTIEERDLPNSWFAIVFNDSSIMNIYNPINFVAATGQFADYNSFCSLRIQSALINETEFEIWFVDKSRIVIDLADNAYRGPDAINFFDVNGLMVVF